MLVISVHWKVLWRGGEDSASGLENATGDEGIVARRAGVASGTPVPSSVAVGRGVLSTSRSTRARPRRTEIAGMGDYLAENKYVEREMKRRSFQVVRGQWQGGVLFEGDPEDDAELELFLRNQYRTLQAEARSAAWGAGRILGRH